MDQTNISKPTHKQNEDCRKVRDHLFEAVPKAKTSKQDKYVQGGRDRADILLVVRYYGETYLLNDLAKGTEPLWYIDAIKSAKSWKTGSDRAAEQTPVDSATNQSIAASNEQSVRTTASSLMALKPALCPVLALQAGWYHGYVGPQSSSSSNIQVRKIAEDLSEDSFWSRATSEDSEDGGSRKK